MSYILSGCVANQLAMLSTLATFCDQSERNGSCRFWLHRRHFLAFTAGIMNFQCTVFTIWPLVIITVYFWSSGSKLQIWTRFCSQLWHLPRIAWFNWNWWSHCRECHAFKHFIVFFLTLWRHLYNKHCKIFIWQQVWGGLKGWKALDFKKWGARA